MAATIVRRAPYKDFLQPALHRRFTSTATVLLLVSYIEAVLLSSWTSYIWSWFPIGPTGVRTLFIFTCGLAILILRIAHYHVGLRTTGSGVQTLATAVVQLQTYETLFWYGFSGILFSHIFLWSMSEGSNLYWITYFSGDRARANERPIFLMCYLASCALMQTIIHYQKDIDRLFMRIKDDKQPNSDTLEVVLFRFPRIFISAATRAIVTLPVALLLYYSVLRSFAWGWALMFLRPFYNLPRTSMLPSSWPSDIFLIFRCIEAGSLLFFIWTAGNFAYTTFMGKEPLKNGKPLTSESKDPNGSILNGLKSKKLSIKAFAMWELAYIAKSFDTRRQLIFEDIDRKDGSMWSQVFATCIDVVKGVEARVDSYGQAPPPPPPAAESTAVEQRHKSSAPLRDDPIFTTRAGSKTMRDEVEKRLGQMARAPGSSPVSKLSPIVKRTWKEAKDRVLSKEQQEAVSPEHILGQFEQIMISLMDVDPVSTLFQQDFRTRFAAAVLGSPYAEPSLCINAIIVLSQLSVHSLVEDQFGNVHRDVPAIIRTLASAIKKLEAFRISFPMHWTDTKGLRASPEVDEVLEAMRMGLDQVLTKFEPYSTDLRLSLTDIRLAKEAIAVPQEMQQVR